MQIIAYMLAFGEDVPIPERIIDLPSNAEGADQGTLLGMSYHYGQNDFQPKPVRSVSVGDVVKLPDGSLHRVLGAGWEHLPADTDVTKLERGLACSIL